MIYDRKMGKYFENQESKLVLFLYKNVIGRFILKLLTRKWLTNLSAWYMRTSLSKRKIKRFIKKYQIDMNMYVNHSYNSFDEFFVRQIKKQARPLINDSKKLISPCDSKLSVYKIDNDTHMHIKNSCYSIKELLQDDDLAKEYHDGFCLVFRLCVDDYHHYSFIDNGKVLSNKKIDGKLHTVRPISHDYCKVFSENKREYMVLDTDNFDKVIYMEVGALLVGKICNLDIKEFKRGDEKGYFRFGGSTIILLFKKDKIEIDEDILENSSKGIETKIEMFEKIGRCYKDV